MGRDGLMPVCACIMRNVRTNHAWIMNRLCMDFEWISVALLRKPIWVIRMGPKGLHLKSKLRRNQMAHVPTLLFKLDAVCQGSECRRIDSATG